MKKYFMLMILLFVPFVFKSVSAEENPSIEKGMQLFNSTLFAGATSGKSCASCHPGGADLQFAWVNPNLTGQVNNCIIGPLRGVPLDEDSMEMQSILLYIQSLKQ